MEEVLALDENAVVLEAKINNETEYNSYHRFNDKSYVQLHYSIDQATQKPVVAEIKELDNKHLVLNYLLPWDFNVILN